MREPDSRANGTGFLPPRHKDTKRRGETGKVEVEEKAKVEVEGRIEEEVRVEAEVEGEMRDVRSEM